MGHVGCDTGDNVFFSPGSDMGFGYLWIETSFKISSPDIDLCIAYVKRLYFLENIQGVQKKNDATFNRYLFLCFNVNWYAISIYYTGNNYPSRVSK